jgi:hypothetical protein
MDSLPSTPLYLHDRQLLFLFPLKVIDGFFSINFVLAADLPQYKMSQM